MTMRSRPYVCAEWQASVVMDAAGDGDEGALHRLHADGCDMGQARDVRYGVLGARYAYRYVSAYIRVSIRIY